MQFLGVPPSAVIAVFTKLVHHQTHILQIEDARFRMPEPKAFRMAAHQSRRACAQLRRRRCGRRHFLQLIRLGSHESNLKTMPARGKKSYDESVPLGFQFSRNRETDFVLTRL